MPKMPKEFICEKCDFKCYKKSNYEIHLGTAKHKILTKRAKKGGNASVVRNINIDKVIIHIRRSVTIRPPNK